MSAMLTAVAVLAVLLVAAYGVAVTERLVADGLRTARSAFITPLAEAATLLRQEDLRPEPSDRFLYCSAPIIAWCAVGLAALVIPLGERIRGFDPAIGLFYFIVVLGPFVIAMMNAGWGSGDKLGVLGAFRAAAHLLAYEVPLGFAVIGPAMAAGSLSLVRIVEGQAGLWYVVWQPLGLGIYLVAALFMTYRRPFDLPLSGRELGGGVLAEYSGPRLLLFRVALNALFVLLMALAVVVFFGGFHGPFLPGPAWMTIKTFALVAAVLRVTRLLPRLRHDQMLSLAWKVLLPASLVHVMVTGVLILFVFGGGP